MTVATASAVSQEARRPHTEIQAIKIATPTTVQWILDKAIQVHGGGGLSQDFPLAYGYALARMLRFVDGPDEVHKNALARYELRRSASTAPTQVAI
jgi:acyl-CoA dehydrogenase